MRKAFFVLSERRIMGLQEAIAKGNATASRTGAIAFDVGHRANHSLSILYSLFSILHPRSYSSSFTDSITLSILSFNAGFSSVLLVNKISSNCPP